MREIDNLIIFEVFNFFQNFVCSFVIIGYVFSIIVFMDVLFGNLLMKFTTGVLIKKKTLKLFSSNKTGRHSVSLANILKWHFISTFYIYIVYLMRISILITKQTAAWRNRSKTPKVKQKLCCKLLVLNTRLSYCIWKQYIYDY